MRTIAMTVAAAAVFLQGCGGLRSDAAPDRIYVMDAGTIIHGAPVGAGMTQPLPGVLVVPRPGVQPGLDTDRIAVARPGNELGYYAASRWSGALPRVLSAFAVQSLRGSFATVTAAEHNAGPADYELLLTVRHFEAVQAGAGAPEVRAAFDCLLVATAPRRVLGSCDAEVLEPAAENRMSAIAAAFERAAGKAMLEVVRQSVDAATAARKSTAPSPP